MYLWKYKFKNRTLSVNSHKLIL